MDFKGIRTGDNYDTILFLDETADKGKFNLYFGKKDLLGSVSPKGDIETIETTLSDDEIRSRIAEWEQGHGLDLVNK